jgi:hypothetical protein
VVPVEGIQRLEAAERGHSRAAGEIPQVALAALELDELFPCLRR